MFSTKIILFAAPFLIGGAVVSATLMHTDKGSVIAESVTNQSVTPQFAEPEVTATDTAPQAALMDVVQMSNPFTDADTSGTMFVTPSDAMFTSIGSVTDYVVDGRNISHVVLPTDFTQIGAAFSQGATDEPITIIHRYNFLIDSSITWSFDQGPSNYQWEEHPNSIAMPAGSGAIVTFTSSDGGRNWIGAVNVGT